MDELRWTLLIAGVVVIAAIYGYTRWQESRRGTRKSRRRALAGDDEVERALSGLDDVVAERDPLEPADDDFEIIRITRDDALAGEPRPSPEPAPPAGSESPPGLQEKLIVINVAATDGRLFSGRTLVQALEAVGMRYGERAIYHRALETRQGRVAMFSAANILQPGTLEPERLDEINSPGVALFMQLPGPFDGLSAFEQMLEAGRRIAEQLDAKLLDERRCSLTNQAIEHIREELREYRRIAHLLAKKV
ncbi:MAG: cell division protein ZipA [Xanthomonadaceae bacterium]|nr:cell division protein ZipA [Xanthomonadaceae bacterium]